MSHDVFISHSSVDKNTADAICHILESNGIRCWIAPRDIPPGAPWAKSLVEAISKAKIMVLIFSSNSCSSEHVLRELGQASKNNVIVIPFRIDDSIPPAEMDYHLNNVHWIDALTVPVENHIQNLADYIKNDLNVDTGKKPKKVTSPPKKKYKVRISYRKLMKIAIISIMVIIALILVVPLVGNLFHQDDLNDWRVLAEKGENQYNKGNIDNALEFFKKQENLARTKADGEGYANALGNQGDIFFFKGEDEKALEYYQKQEEIAREGKINYEIVSSYGKQGIVYFNKGDTNNAIIFFDEEENLAKIIGDPQGQINAINFKARISCIEGDFDNAEGLLYQQELICDVTKDWGCYSSLKLLHGLISFYKGDSDSAINQFLDAEKICSENNDYQCQSDCKQKLTEIYISQNDFEKASKKIIELETLSKNMNDNALDAKIKGFNGLIALNQGDFEKAGKLLKKEQVLSAYNATWIDWIDANIHLGRYFYEIGDYDKAKGFMQHYGRSTYRKGNIDAHMYLALIYSKDPDTLSLAFKEIEKAHALAMEASMNKKIGEIEEIQTKIYSLQNN